MRLIDADALSETLKQMIQQADMKILKNTMALVTSPHYKILKKQIEEILNGLSKFPTIEQQEWISCSERLPSDHERYLLTEEVHYATGRIIRRVLVAFYDDENDEWYEEMGEDVEVVSYPLAWMPLPEPYKEGTE